MSKAPQVKSEANVDRKEFKRQLFNDCLLRLEQRRIEIINELDEITIAITNESKSSAGDKHETSRALMQNQREQIGQRLKETEAMVGALQQIDLQNVNTVIRSGSLVTTNKGNFLISIAYGRLDTGDKAYYFISPQSPLAIAMTGKKRGDQFSFSNQEYQIVDVE